jgi:type VI secretion system secreted protein Hcp
MKIKNQLTFLALVTATLLFASLRAQAAYDIYMQATGLTGESMSQTHPQWTEVYSVSFGVSNTTDPTATIPSPGIPQISSISLMKKVDKTSPILIQNCNMGTSMTTVTLDFEQRGETATVFYKITLDGAVINSVQQSGAAGGDDNLTESVTISFRRIKWSYTPIDPKTGNPGTKVETGWDRSTNKKF